MLNTQGGQIAEVYVCTIPYSTHKQFIIDLLNCSLIQTSNQSVYGTTCLS